MDDQEKKELRKWVKRREDMFLRRLFGMFAKMAKADGRIDAWETHAAEKAFEVFPRAAARRKFCINIFNTAGTSSISLLKMAWDFTNSCAMYDDCLAAYGILWDIACAKGILKPVHKSHLLAICRYLNLPGGCYDINYQSRAGAFREWTVEDERKERDEAWKAQLAREAEIRRRVEECRREEARRKAEAEAREHERWKDYQRRMHDWYTGGGQHESDGQEDRHSPSWTVSPLQAEYDLLGCAPNASDDVVRTAYRTEAKKYHPDLLRAKGCSASAIADATTRMARINAAWEKVKKSRGI